MLLSHIGFLQLGFACLLVALGIGKGAEGHRTPAAAKAIMATSMRGSLRTYGTHGSGGLAQRHGVLILSAW